jgi:hypothetical protein
MILSFPNARETEGLHRTIRWLILLAPFPEYMSVRIKIRLPFFCFRSGRAFVSWFVLFCPSVFTIKFATVFNAVSGRATFGHFTLSISL